MADFKVNFVSGQEIQGFRVVDATPVPGLRGVAVRLEHLGCGARVLHLACDDSENAFTINFPTPPPDDSGMPHILEHMVLAGSRKFPVKEPFFEMVKMSMATFINAMTGYDCTYYPVCSNVPRDLFNLADVYFDAVFHPLLSESTFKREAHHLAPADPSDPLGALRIDGVVYSEMKGVFSDPESILGRHAVRSLLPDTCYGLESGGAPESIPELTYERLKAFHARQYHPGRAYFCFYGNIPTADYLAFLAPRLEGVAPVPSDPPPGRQPRWSAPRHMNETYPIEADEPRNEKTYLLLSWLAGDALDALDAARLRVLSLLLLGHEAAPLYRALIDSRLGADLVMAGAGEAGPEATFHVGLEGSEPDRMEAFRDLTLETLRKLEQTPFTPEQVRTAFQQATYESVEILPMFPLHTVFKIVNAWIADRDPLLFLDMDDHLRRVREEWRANPALFNEAIRTRLLGNPHRLDIVLAPDAEQAALLEREQRQRLERERKRLTDEDMRRIAEEAQALAQSAAAPNPPEAVALLPQLQPADLPSEPRTLPTCLERIDGETELLVTDLPTNGIVYLRLQFDLAGLPPALWPLLPRYAEAIGKFGAAGQDYAVLAERIGAHTGGISASPSVVTRVDDPAAFRPSLRISMKTLEERLPDALDLLGDLLFELNPRDRGRMRDVLSQARAENRAGMVQNGSATVKVQAARELNLAGHLDYRISGLPQLDLTEGWVRDESRAYEEVAGGIETIRDFLLNRRRLTVSLTAPPAAREVVRSRLSAWRRRMSGADISRDLPDFSAGAAPRWEGLAAPLQISHSAWVMPAPHASHPDETLLAVGAHLVTMDYMLPEIRFKGHAYGAGCSYQPLDGALLLSAYRDPGIRETIETYRRVAEYVRRVAWTQVDIDRGIIGVARRDEKPLRPSEATSVALSRHTTGNSYERRRARRRHLLQATPDEVRRATLAALEAGLPRAALCVMSGRAQLEAANKHLGDQPLTIRNVFNQPAS